MGSEYFFGGVGFFVSVEGNIPVKTLALGARGAFGGAMFMTDNVGPRFTPMINAVPLALQKTWKEAPSPVEFQYGLIFYIGGKNVKSINQFNGLYIGGGLEVPKVGSSEMANRSSASGALLYNVQTGTYAAVIMKSLNAGSHMVAINTQIMYVNNISRTGGGAKVSDIYSGTLNEISQRFSDASESLSNYVGSWTGSKN